MLQQADGEDELKKRQLMELAIINGTYRDSSSKTSSGTGATVCLSLRMHARALLCTE